MIKEIKGNQLYFAKGNDNVKIPTKRSEDAGYDIYANFEEDFMLIPPHTTKLIPTNLYCAFSEGYVMILKERGSNGVKGIGQRSGVIDSGFRNAIGVPLTNTNDAPIIIVKKHFVELLSKAMAEYVEYIKENNLKYLGDINNSIIYPYEKAICQAILLPVPKMDIQEISVGELQSIPSERGQGMLGSSGK